MNIQFDRQKFKDVVHYICASCDPSNLGAVKLNKVLYYSDMFAFALLGQPVTGAPYRKRALGPTCDYVPKALRELEEDGSIAIRESLYFGYRKKDYISKKPANDSRLSGAERALLSDVIEFVCKNNSAKTISQFSHNRAWELVKFGDVIPYHSVFHMFASEPSEDSMKWAATEGAAVEAARSNAGTVERRSYGAFRARVLQASD